MIHETKAFLSFGKLFHTKEAAERHDRQQQAIQDTTDRLRAEFEHWKAKGLTNKAQDYWPGGKLNP